MFLLLGAIDVHITAGMVLATAMLGIGVPASRFVARFVENKKSTFTGNGALFVSLISLPHDGSWAIGAVEWRFVQIDPTDSDAVTNTLHTQIESFPGIGNASEGPTSHL